MGGCPTLTSHTASIVKGVSAYAPGRLPGYAGRSAYYLADHERLQWAEAFQSAAVVQGEANEGGEGEFRPAPRAPSAVLPRRGPER
jgi:hypothetical protein